MTRFWDRRSVISGIGAAATMAVLPRTGAALDVSAADMKKPAKLRVGTGPFISSGPLFIALARGYFGKVNLQVETQSFVDGAVAIPSLAAGELDLATTTCNAGLFNSISKGAKFKICIDRGQERSGYSVMTMMVSAALHGQGLTGLDKFAMLKGKRIAVQAPGSIDQYLFGNALKRSGLGMNDVEWMSRILYPDMVKLMGAGQVDAAEIPVSLGSLGEKQKVGKIVGYGDQIEPSAQISCYAVQDDVVRKNPSAVVRFAMAHIHAAREFNKAAAAADPEVVAIIQKETRLPTEAISSIAPHWSWMDEEGVPNVKSVMRQAEFWKNDFSLLTVVPKEEQVFDLSIVKAANAELAKGNPFV